MATKLHVKILTVFLCCRSNMTISFAQVQMQELHKQSHVIFVLQARLPNCCIYCLGAKAPKERKLCYFGEKVNVAVLLVIVMVIM